MHKIYLPIFLVLSFLCLSSCSSSGSQPLSPPKGKQFPTISGKSLAGEKVEFPTQIAGRPAILIIGYLQNAQFDIDRWLYGILENKLDAAVYEIPTIAGLIPRVISDRIDNGMRSGIPKEDWNNVVTVYRDADKIIQTIGNENPKNGHVVLLDSHGKIRWVHDRGFSPSMLLELKSRLNELSQE